MGFFRRYKLSDYTADECRKRCQDVVNALSSNRESDRVFLSYNNRVEKFMEEWACFRELLARHEGNNKSQLDKDSNQ